MTTGGPGSMLAREHAADALAKQMTGLAPRPERHERAAPLSTEATAALARGARRSMDSTGQPLPAETRKALEHATGADLSGVRVHASDAAGRFAASVGANAATVGQNILGSAARLNPATAGGLRLLSHEAAHAVQQRQSAVPAVALDVIDDVRDKLSYGLRDWAVTDADATSSLAALAALPAPALAAGLGRLEQKYLDRLIDNLPDSAKSGPAYQRVLAAIGVARALPSAEDSLSYGLFDWAVTDTDVSNVFNTMANLPAAQQEAFLAGLDAKGKLGRLINNSNAGHQGRYIRPWISSLTPGRLTAGQQRILRVIVTESDDGALPTLILAAGTRFDVPVGRGAIASLTAADWTVPALRQTYLALDGLPDGHVARNAAFRRLGAFTEGADARGETTTGVYSGRRLELDMNVAETQLTETALHETGHAVDKQMGWTTGSEPANASRGGWVQYAINPGIVAHDMVDDSHAGIFALPTVQRDDVETEMSTAMTNRSVAGMLTRIRARPWYAGLGAPVKAAITADPALPAIGTALDHPWFKPDGGDRLGAPDAHVYELSDPPSWNRYNFEARTRMVTPYQFNGPPDWFAEVYAHYFGGPEKRRLLTRKDPGTAAYFASTVAPLAPSR
ncbi:eCIS core domain-containing protein [Arthrobacter sp. HY1533]|uniref:eCIS core domain-containing protein n=1 Tax=Arthrobacter sp. HY1533 TaxID=2970919 RepID=UPI0022BA02B3|nr:DUF4157 domain-containing protein [Arthrobacter sp. HY1533]